MSTIVATCPHGDETCPCPDGDQCHYEACEDCEGSAALPMRCPTSGLIDCTTCSPVVIPAQHILEFLGPASATILTIQQHAREAARKQGWDVFKLDRIIGCEKRGDGTATYRVRLLVIP